MKEHWPQIKALFAAAIELPVGERRAFVGGAEAAPEVREQVLQMVDSYELEETKFLTRPGSSLGPQATPLPSEGPGLKRLGAVRVEGVIGRGAMGYVLLGYDERLDRQVALKCLPATSSMSEEQNLRFATEARSIAQLDHPNIVTVYGVETEGDDSFIVMAHLAGPDLRQELETLRAGDPGAHLPAFGEPGYIGAVVELVRQLADALAHAHAQGVIHRDVKPANLIYDALGRPILVDFGLARIAGTASMTMDSDVRGTAHYMSPEQARLLDDNTIDGRTDVYALGCVLYELLTLAKPYPGEGYQEVFAAKAAGRPTPARALNSALPQDLATICEVAIARLPGDRYASAADFAEDLARFLDHRSIRARPPSLPRRGLRWARRNAGAIALGTALVAASVLVTVWGLDELRRSGYPQVQLALSDRDGDPLSRPSARVLWAPLNESTGAPGPARPLGRLSEAPFRIAPGGGRLRVELGPGDFAEVSLVVAEDDPEQGFSVMLPAGEAPDLSGMTEIPGGRFRELPGFDPALYPEFERVEVADFLLDRREVTHAEFFAFAQQFPQHISAWWHTAGLLDAGTGLLLQHAELPAEWAELPVTLITHEAASAYAAWRGCRLPTRFELDWAAAEFLDPGSRRPYPTDEESEMTDPGFAGRILPVTRPDPWTTRAGVEHLLDNARELTETPVSSINALDLSRCYFSGSTGVQPEVEPTWPLRIAPIARSTQTAHASVGLRCARSLP